MKLSYLIKARFGRGMVWSSSTDEVQQRKCHPHRKNHARYMENHIDLYGSAGHTE